MTLRPSTGLQTIRRPKWVIIGSNIYDNWRQRTRFRRGDVQGLQGSTHRDWPISKSLDYIQRVFSDYLAYGEITEEEIHGKTVLELGPGDNLGVALKFLAAGAARVTCLDKVFSVRDTRQEHEIYRALRQTCSPLQRQRIDAAVDLDAAVIHTDELRYMYGVGIEEAGRLMEPGSFDLIVSRAVLMEIHRLEEGFQAMDRLLAPGGLMIHQIAPCHDYGLFTQYGYHPLEYLTIPDWLYGMMARDSGKPNRRLVDAYRAAVTALGFTVRLHITGVVGSDATAFPPNTLQLEAGKHYSEETARRIREIQPRLQAWCRQATDEELMIGGAFLVARKENSGQ